MNTHKNLTVCRLTQSQHLGTCGYWFTVREDGMAHTAFATQAGLMQWAMQRGLTIPEILPREGAHDDLADRRHRYCRIIGSYRTQMHMNHDDFDALKPMFETRDLSNGDYVEAKVTLDADGLRTVHTLNPNVRNRHTFDYHETKEMMK